VKVVECIHTFSNEYSEITNQVFCQDATQAELKEQLKMDSASRNLLGKAQPSLIYVDNCCTSRKGYEDVFPTLTSDLNPFEPLEVQMDRVRKVKVKSSDDIAAIYEFIKPLLRRVEGLSPGERLKISLDSEWDVKQIGIKSNGDPVFIKDGKVCLIQISYNEENNVDATTGMISYIFILDVSLTLNYT